MQGAFAELSGIVVILDVSDKAVAKDRESTLHDQQMADRSLKVNGYYISNNILPDNEKEVYHLILSCQKFTILAQEISALILGHH